ncbi:MAG: hypothetical protein U0235_31485 [Polyangiaceae bacterium]
MALVSSWIRRSNCTALAPERRLLDVEEAQSTGVSSRASTTKAFRVEDAHLAQVEEPLRHAELFEHLEAALGMCTGRATFVTGDLVADLDHHLRAVGLALAQEDADHDGVDGRTQVVVEVGEHDHRSR